LDAVFHFAGLVNVTMGDVGGIDVFPGSGRPRETLILWFATCTAKQGQDHRSVYCNGEWIKLVEQGGIII
jgi:hypothetical protein